MVLESVVSALLSKYLGDYVDGLSTENLSLGIFSGEVVLENLALKRSALAGLHLPVTVKAGYLGARHSRSVRWRHSLYVHTGKLTLKIPWKNLGTQPTIITVDKLFLIAVPNPLSAVCTLARVILPPLSYRI